LATAGNQPLPATVNAEEVQLMVGEQWQAVLFGQQTVEEALANIEQKWMEISAK
jgi:hypothetical protein